MTDNDLPQEGEGFSFFRYVLFYGSQSA
uniref:Uncharacterized protein n=1 Tax=Arundo donax TaxID=35708 RepID=A0A0A8Z8F1_ARUDO